MFIKVKIIEGKLRSLLGEIYYVYLKNVIDFISIEVLSTLYKNSSFRQIPCIVYSETE